MADIDITSEGKTELEGFEVDEKAVANLVGIADTIVAASAALPMADLPEGIDFREIANHSADQNKTFTTNVKLGFYAFKNGAKKMAWSYDAADQQMAWTMEDVTTGPARPTS